MVLDFLLDALVNLFIGTLMFFASLQSKSIHSVVILKLCTAQ